MTEPKSVSKQRTMRWWMPVLLLALYAALIAFLRATDDYRRGIMIPVFGAFVLLLLGVWYAFFTGLPWRRRLALGVVGLAVLVGAGLIGPRVFRWEGSRDGMATPRLVWRWSESTSPAATNAPVRAFTAPEIPLPGLADFPRYLGSSGDGVVKGVELDPDWAGKPPKLLWRQAIGLGWSGFVVSGRRAVTQEQRGDDELVSCYEVGSGALLWMHTNHVRFTETMGGDGPRATPSIDGDQVFAQGATGLLDCLDLATGKSLWSTNVLAGTGAKNLMWGKSNGPLIDEDRVIETGGPGGPTLLAFDRKSGQRLWLAGTDDASYASPVLMNLAGQTQIVSVNAGSVSGHARETGNLLWSYPWKGPEPKVGQPISIPTNRVLISAGYGLGSTLLEIHPTTGEVWTAEAVWKSRSIRNKFSSLVVDGKFAYGLEEETLACLDLESGKRVWKDGRYGFGQILKSGPLLLVQTESGIVVLVDVDGAEWRERGRLAALTSKTWNPPALAGNILVVRNDQEAAAYELPSAVR